LSIFTVCILICILHIPCFGSIHTLCCPFIFINPLLSVIVINLYLPYFRYLLLYHG
jgi:hypothetical protein